MQLTPLRTAKPFKFTTQPYSTQRDVHQSARFSKVHNSVKLDVRSSEWDDTRCVTYPWDTLDRNRKFSEIKRSKMLKLVHNLRCHSNFAKRALLDSYRQNSPKIKGLFHEGRWLHWRRLSTKKSKFCHLAMPPLEKVELSFLWSISVRAVCAYTVMQKTACSYIAAILSELHAP